jgi:aminoglycoside phosphotransferase (APT) family kinase protein
VAELTHTALDHRLLAYLDEEQPDSPGAWEGWTIRPVSGGANNRLYRATSADADLAVKWTLRDERDRAGREYAALALLERTGLALAPRALLLDRERYRLPVVVQTWLAGEVLVGPPHSDDDWRALVGHLAAFHTATAAQPLHTLAGAVITASSGQEGKALVARHAAQLPLEAQPPELRRLLASFEAWTPQDWPMSPHALCRTDPNWRNLLRRPGAWASVDWENSGVGDPAFDLADLLTHPAYDPVPPERWPWVVERYAEAVGDRWVQRRVWAYELVLRVWWAVRWARTLYEVPRGLDPRLAERSPGWQRDAEVAFAHAVERAARRLEAEGVR